MMPFSETFFSRLGAWKSRLEAFLQGVEDVAIELSSYQKLHRLGLLGFTARVLVYNLRNLMLLCP
ncbi:hypothetical protein [Tychonema sp. BBK16]|uniref:hypothetical protein n=1 Tax=Tychonema sp. BBK16 TaxID=2699888 RepID=UPI001F1E2991|nr:hypothetical protein [Tychonema sp. BBK16]MCF6375780.1 hypothetical protein [Tychonema sp. BBK16]